MKRLALRGLLTLLVAAVAGGLASVGGPPARANHVVIPDEMTIFHSGVCTPPALVPACVGMDPGPGAGGSVLVATVGVPFSVQVAVVQGGPWFGFQWELAWTDALVSVAFGTTYLDTSLPLCAAPATAIIGPVELYGAGGAGCVSPGPPVLFANPVLTASLVCVAPGVTDIALVNGSVVDPPEDAAFGGTLFAPGFVPIPTVMENQIPTTLPAVFVWGPSYAGIVVSCVPAGGPDNDGPAGTFGGTVPPAPSWIRDGFLPEGATLGTDAVDTNDDNDLCADAGDAFPMTPWNVVDMWVPSLPGTGGAVVGGRGGFITIADVLAILPWIGTIRNGIPGGIGVIDYDNDVNLNGAPDGGEYDRTPGVTPGPPSGAVTLADALVVLARVGMPACPGP